MGCFKILRISLQWSHTMNVSFTYRNDHFRLYKDYSGATASNDSKEM